MRQGVQVEQGLRVVPPPAETKSAEAAGGRIDFLYEPDKQQLLDALLPLFVQSQLYRALLEPVASEVGSLVTAMEPATKNTKDATARYTLHYNRTRQATITMELNTIVGAA